MPAECEQFMVTSLVLGTVFLGHPVITLGLRHLNFKPSAIAINPASAVQYVAFTCGTQVLVVATIRSAALARRHSSMTGPPNSMLPSVQCIQSIQPLGNLQVRVYVFNGFAPAILRDYTLLRHHKSSKASAWLQFS